jgi:hypothetical protein
MFESNLRDERYLPFEGAGAVSTWRLELPTTFKSFDYSTISDVILHLRYTAKEGGQSLRAAAVSGLQAALNMMMTSEKGRGVARLFSVRQEFPTEWHRLLNAITDGSKDHQAVLALGPERFPFYLRDRFLAKKIEVTKLHVVALVKERPDGAIPIYVAPLGDGTGDSNVKMDLSPNGSYGDSAYGEHMLQQPEEIGDWTLLIKSGDFNELKDKDGEPLLKDLLLSFELTMKT